MNPNSHNTPPTGYSAMTDSAVDLLKQLIATPRTSRNEQAAADLVFGWLTARGCAPERVGNNVWALAQCKVAGAPTVMLNAHLDTVPAAAGYTRNPLEPAVEGDRLYGLGANDDGASVVSLIHAFLAARQNGNLPYNLLLALTAEEEVGGEGGMRMLLPHLTGRGLRPDMAIVGEPTGMEAAVAEKGLVVLDCVTTGVAGHAARDDGSANAICRAIDDIRAITGYRFDRTSAALGPIRVSVTMIEAGTRHNVIPDRCNWVVDVRTTDAYTNAETAALLAGAVSQYTTTTPRSTRVHASALPQEHPLMLTVLDLDIPTFASVTTSDMSLLHGIPALKTGPGDSTRSHRADEYIRIAEIAAAIPAYRRLLDSLARFINLTKH